MFYRFRLVNGLILFFLFLSSVPAFAPHFSDLTPSEFLTEVLTRWQHQNQQVSVPPMLEQGETGNISPAQLILGQDEISVDNVMVKLGKREHDGDLIWRPSQNRWQMMHQNGTSPLSHTEPILVMKGPMGYVVKDGHHDLFLSLFVGAESVPIKVVEDFSHLSKEEFWAKVKGETGELPRVFLKRSAASLAQRPPSLAEVTDNPNRYLASLMALRMKAAWQGQELEVLKRKGPKAAVWLKLGNGVPFIEFYLARILADAGIHYDRKWGDRVPPEVIEKARTAILAAVKAGTYPQLKDILIFASPEEAETIRREQVLPLSLKKMMEAQCKREQAQIGN